MKENSIVIICILLTSTVSAQQLKLAGIDYFSYGKSPVKIGSTDGEISFRELTVFGNYPVRLKNNKTVLINGVRYAWVQPITYGIGMEKSNTHNFHSISYNLRLIHPLKNDWTAGITLSPTLASDFKAPLSGDDFVMQGAFTLSKKINEKKYIGGGITYSTSLGIPVPLPLFLFVYNGERHHLNLFLPALANYTYAVDPAQHLKAGFRMGLNGAYFNYNGDDANQGQPTAGKINYSRANLGPTISYRIGNYLQLEAFGGLSALRRYRFEETNGEKTKFDSEASGFFNIGITLMPPAKQKK